MFKSKIAQLKNEPQAFNQGAIAAAILLDHVAQNSQLFTNEFLKI
jgi:hypothetical protein